MSWVPLSKDKHFEMGLAKKINYSFVGRNILLPVQLFELPNFTPIVPLVFTQKDGVADFFGLFGLVPGNNLFVDQLGNWKGEYLPSVLSAFPFSRGAQKEETQDEDKWILAINDEENLKKDFLVEKSQGIPFFNDDATLSEFLQSRLDLLGKIHLNQRTQKAACAKIVEFELLEEWPISFQDNNKASNLGGIYRINQEKYSVLSDAQYIELRRLGALNFIFANGLSHLNLKRLGRLHRFKMQHTHNSLELGESIFGANGEEAFSFDFN